jgi:hypothetical protein
MISSHGEHKILWGTNVVMGALQKKFFVMQAYKLLRTDKIVKKVA